MLYLFSLRVYIHICVLITYFRIDHIREYAIDIIFNSIKKIVINSDKRHEYYNNTDKSSSISKP